MSKKPTTPTRYQEWVSAGKKYHKGLSMLNEVPGFATLKKTLSRGPSQYNTAKLEAMLKRHFGADAQQAAAQPAGKARKKAQAGHQPGHETHRQQEHTSAPPAPPVDTTVDTDADMGGDTNAAEDGTPPSGGDGDDDDDPLCELRDEPPEYTPRTWKARPFSQLPEPLKKLRIAIIRDYRERARKHSELRAHPPRREDRTLLCRAIVELTDRINEHWAIEERWTKDGTLPHLPEDEEQRIATTDVFRLQRELANQVNPQLTRINVKLRADEAGRKRLPEDERTALEMRKGALERTKGLIKARLLAYQQQVKA